MTKLVAGSATDVGLVRTTNQDQLLVVPGLYAVADGMGGHAAGEIASLTAVRSLRAAFEAAGQRSAQALLDAAKAANHAIWEQARANRDMFGMGTTLVALAVVEHDDGTNGLAVVHIGDSRVYSFRAGQLHQITVDHSLVQELVDDGQITAAQAAVHPQRNVLTRALGVEPVVDLDLININPERGDRYLLCSDGLCREASDEQIAAALRQYADPSAVAKALVALAKSQGGSDNITVVVVDVLADDDSADSLDLRAIVPQDTTASMPAVAHEGGDDDPVATGRRHGGPPLWRSLRRSLRPLFTFRLASFVTAVAVVIGAVLAGLAWYARSTYFVGLRQGRIAIFQGQPGGVLWFNPTVAAMTDYTTKSVLAYRVQGLQSGIAEPSLTRAWAVIDDLVAEKEAAEAASRPRQVAPRPNSSTRRTTSSPVSSTVTRARTATTPRKTTTAATATTARGALTAPRRPTSARAATTTATTAAGRASRQAPARPARGATSKTEVHG
ncbi:MAG: Stp1/IreP family PP2C-type Ser/Thr phosphatase [Acidimicrobiales bacterium]